MMMSEVARHIVLKCNKCKVLSINFEITLAALVFKGLSLKVLKVKSSANCQLFDT